MLDFSRIAVGGTLVGHSIGVELSFGRAIVRIIVRERDTVWYRQSVLTVGLRD